MMMTLTPPKDVVAGVILQSKLTARHHALHRVGQQREGNGRMNEGEQRENKLDLHLDCDYGGGPARRMTVLLSRPRVLLPCRKIAE